MDYEEIYPEEIRQGFADDEMCVLMMYAPISQRSIPIVIGNHEAKMIMMEREGVQSGRPMTHELIESIFLVYNLELKEVTIDHFAEGVFHATLHVSDGNQISHIDSRASDAIVLALRAEVAIKMACHVIDETGYSDHSDDRNIIISEPENPFEDMTIEEMESLLQECEDAEEYEKAADILEYIKQKKLDRQ